MTNPLFESESIHSLSGVEPDLPSDDLSILGEIVASAKVVGLGEPTHGQKEINQLRDRMTRYLIEHKGFRVVAIEDSAIRCRIVDDFIVHGQGTAIDALTSQNFWTWKTREVLGMIEWLRGWNVNHPDDPVRFIGFDIQDFATPVTELFGEFLRMDINMPSGFQLRLSEFGTISMWGDVPFAETQYQSDLHMLSEIQDMIGRIER